MMLHKRYAKTRKLAQVFFWVFGIGNLVAAVWGKLPERKDTAGPVWVAVRETGQSYSAAMILACTVGAGGCALLRNRLGAQQTWDTLHNLVTELRDAIFQGDGYDDPDHHRVTIFKVRSFSPWDPLWKQPFYRLCNKPRWLVPVVRSHHLGQETKTCFPLADESIDCYGVAGHAYALKRVVSVDSLPDVSSDGSTGKDIKVYSGLAYVPKDWVQEKKPRARSILAMPLIVSGNVWGVLVFDSRLPGKIKYDELADIFEVIQKHINQLLSKHL